MDEREGRDLRGNAPAEERGGGDEVAGDERSGQGGGAGTSQFRAPGTSKRTARTVAPEAARAADFAGGYLDLLLAGDDDDRSEVEIMLGATDPSHIIRCIEYWDQERRSYPAYDHTAVIVAEDITSRFLNVIGLFGGSIPIVALQMRALEFEDSITLDFLKVVDHRMLRNDDERADAGPSADRSYWEQLAKGQAHESRTMVQALAPLRGARHALLGVVHTASGRIGQFAASAMRLQRALCD